MLAAQLRDRCSDLTLVEFGNDLAVGETRFRYGTPRGKHEKTLLLASASCGGATGPAQLSAEVQAQLRAGIQTDYTRRLVKTDEMLAQ